MVISKPNSEKIIEYYGNEFASEFSNEIEKYAKEKSELASIIYSKGLRKVIRSFLLKNKDLKEDLKMIENYAIKYFSFKLCEILISKMEYGMEDNK